MDRAQEAAYADYVKGHWRDLVRAAVFLGADLHEAEDLAQTTLVRCYSGWDRVSGADNRDAYVYRMLLNALRDVRRSRWWKSRVDMDLEVVVDDRTEGVAIADAVQRALAGLSKVNREVVVLRYFVQLSEAQTAAVLGVPAGTVKSRLSRAHWPRSPGTPSATPNPTVTTPRAASFMAPDVTSPSRGPGPDHTSGSSLDLP